MRIAWKRLWRDAAFLAMLAAVLVVPVLGYRAGATIQTPPFGFVCEDPGEDGERLSRELIEAGFVPCANADELRREIGRAHLDCGIVVGSELEKNLSAGSPEETILLITSPETLMSDLCRMEAVSALSLVYSPYVTYEALAGAAEAAEQKAAEAAGRSVQQEAAPLTIDAVKKEYYGMVDAGKCFTFAITMTDGRADFDRAISINLFRGSLAILIFLTAWVGICRTGKKNYREMRGRLGTAGTWLRVLLPVWVLRLCVLALAGVLSCLCVGQFSLIRPVLLYTGIAGAAGLAVTMLLPDAALLILTVLISIVSMGICPMFTDLAAVLPVVHTLRYGLLPYLIWIL